MLEMHVADERQDRQKALDAAVGLIQKHFGKGAIMKMSQSSVEKIESIPTGSIALDNALGIGGFPKGRIVEIFGLESSGKTTLALHTIAEAQKCGGVCAFIDAEHALDPVYAKRLGVKVEDLFVSQPDNGEQALNIVECLVRSGGVDVVVVDSVAALTPKSEIDGEMGDQHMGLQARLISQALRKLTSPVSKAGCILVFINQVRMKIGVVYGNPETTTGGNSLKFYSSIRIEVRKLAAIKEKENVVGNRVKVKVVKNKVSPPFKEAEFDIVYNEGISHFGEVIDLGVKFNIIDKAGAYYSYGGVRLGQGRENAKLYLKSDPALTMEIASKIKDMMSSIGYLDLVPDEVEESEVLG